MQMLNSVWSHIQQQQTRNFVTHGTRVCFLMHPHRAQPVLDDVYIAPDGSAARVHHCLEQNIYTVNLRIALRLHLGDAHTPMPKLPPEVMACFSAPPRVRLLVPDTLRYARLHDDDPTGAAALCLRVRGPAAHFAAWTPAQRLTVIVKALGHGY